MSSERCRRRRQRILNRLGDGVLVLATAPLHYRNGDVHHAFRPDSDFYYLCGFDEPESVLVAKRIDRKRHEVALFLRPSDRAREVWDGPRLGPRAAIKKLGVDRAFPIESLYLELEKMVAKSSRVFYTMGIDDVMDRSLMRVFERLSALDYRGNPPAHPAIHDPRPTIALERLRKDSSEVEALERAAAVSVRGHVRAMQTVRPGMMEYELQAELEAEFRRHGSRRNGYESIVASGPNACVLHYVSNDRRIRKGELVLVDAGAELDLYTADITRTFPASGTFTEAQADVYDVVLRAQKAAIRAATPGRPWNAPHQAAVRTITSGLERLGVLRRSRKKSSDDHTPWFMHGTSHWLGMDVHDVGGYTEAGKPRKLQPGMVLTIEPGLYFARRDARIPARYRGIGIRIEDDVVVTSKGNRVLTDDVPKEIADIERVCRS